MRTLRIRRSFVALLFMGLFSFGCDSGKTPNTSLRFGGVLARSGGGDSGGVGGTSSLTQSDAGGMEALQGGAIKTGGTIESIPGSGGAATGGGMVDAGRQRDLSSSWEVRPWVEGVDVAHQLEVGSNDTMVRRDTQDKTSEVGDNRGENSIQVWLAGDSTMASCASTCPCGWGGAFDSLFNNQVIVVNSAVGGRSIQTWLYDANVSTTKDSDGECTLSSKTFNARWSAMLHSRTGMKPGDYLFIQFGINDGTSACPRHVGSIRYQDYLGMMAQAAKDRGAYPVFLTPTAAIECSGNTAVASRGFLTETKAAGTRYGVPVIDLHQLSIQLYNQLKLCPNSGDYSSGKVGDFFCADHTHFESAGAAQIAKVISKALTDQGIALGSFLLTGATPGP